MIFLLIPKNELKNYSVFSTNDFLAITQWKLIGFGILIDFGRLYKNKLVEIFEHLIEPRESRSKFYYVNFSNNSLLAGFYDYWAYYLYNKCN